MLPPLTSLRFFHVASRSENFSAAAETLCVTPSAVSHQIKLLEGFLQRPLFVRNQRRMQLTDSGRIYAKRIGDLFANLELDTKEFLESSACLRLAIQVPSSFAAIWLVPRLSNFIQQHPEIEIQILTDNTPPGKEADCEIRYGHGKWPNTQVHLLWTEKLRLLAAPGGPKLRTLADLANVPLIHTRSRAHGWPDLFRKYGIQAVKPSSGHHFDRTGLALEAAMAGLGVALESPLIAQRLIKDGSLRRVLDEIELADESYYLVLSNGTASESALRFKNWLQEQVDASSAYLSASS